MRHFDITEWAAFANSAAPDSSHAAMQNHLDSGCSRCQLVVGQFRKVVATLAHDTLQAPPDHALRSIKAYFGLHRPDAESVWQRLRLHRAFDSAPIPSAAGIRGTQAGLRHITYESGRFTVDLTVEQSAGSREGVVAGQLLEQGEPKAPVPEIPAFLLSQGTVAATGLTSDQGAFSLEGDVDCSCELWFFPDAERIIGVTWDGAFEEEPVH